jgi:DNA polymerase I-like protein with 3'-5' exonuclease and polymerase domains
MLLNIPESEVTKPQRQIAKSAAFGLLYGAGPQVFCDYARTAYGISMTLGEATNYRNRFFAAYPGLQRWHKEVTTVQHIDEDTGNTWFTTDDAVDIRTLAGRIRRNVTIYTQKTNTPVQGTGGDIIKAAVGYVYHDMAKFPGLKLVNIVHDEIMVECDIAQAEAVGRWLQGAMEAAMDEITNKGVVAAADVLICQTWGDDKPAVLPEQLSTNS